MIKGENNQNKQGGRKLKTVDYCLQYGTNLKINVKYRYGHENNNDLLTGTSIEITWSNGEGSCGERIDHESSLYFVYGIIIEV